MKAMPLAPFAAFVLASLLALLPAPASAQGNPGRDNVYVVAGVYVDETAANASAAQQAGFASAQGQGFARLVARLTIPEELGRLGAPAVEAAGLEQLVLSVDVEEERRSATRYIGRLTVRYDPASVRALLRARSLSVVDTRTAPVLVVPTASFDVAPEALALWRQVWEQGGFQAELVPLVAAPAALMGAPDWSAAQPFAVAAAAASALYATLRIQGATVAASLVEVAANGVSRDRGAVAAGVNGEGAPALRAALASLAEQASARLQTEWKGRIAAGTGQRTRVSATALYGDQQQWQQIKQSLQDAAQTLISEIRIEAVAREGALVSFSYVGDRTQMAAELARRGVTLTEEPRAGPVLRAAPR